MSYRRLWVLVNRLPQESWTQTALRDEQSDSPMLAPAAGEQTFGPWALDNYQLAALGDAVRRLEWTLAKVHGNDWKPPEPTPTPTSRRRVAKRTPAQITYLSGLRAKGA